MTPDSLYLNAELFDLTAQRDIRPRARVVPAGEPFPGFGLPRPDAGASGEPGRPEHDPRSST